MKTPEEIIKLYPGLAGLKLNDIEQASLEMAMKEYAKTWIDELYSTEYLNHLDVPLIKAEIDAQ